MSLDKWYSLYCPRVTQDQPILCKSIGYKTAVRVWFSKFDSASGHHFKGLRLIAGLFHFWAVPKLCPGMETGPCKAQKTGEN